MKHLNDIPGFDWATLKLVDGERCAKVCVGRESFWIAECVEESDGKISGEVANVLLFTCEHGLMYGDRVTFTPERPSDLA